MNADLSDGGWTPLRREIRVVVVVDMVDSVPHYERDEEGTARRWFALVDFVQQQFLPCWQGRLVRSLGDGLLLEFDAAGPAVRFAAELQAHMQVINRGQPVEGRLWMRCAVHVGEIIPDTRDIQGRVVNMTARLASIAHPGGVVVSAGVRDQIVDGLDADLVDMGECFVKGLSAPVRAYCLSNEHSRTADPDPSAAPLATPSMRPTVAVVPFAGRGSDPRLDVIAEAIADEVINALSRTPELSVISRLSTTSLRLRDNLPTLVRDTLGAGYLATGTARIVREQLQVHIEVVELVGQRVVWADTLSTPVDQAVGMESDLARRICNQICDCVLANELQLASTKPLPNLNAYTMLLGGVLLLHRGARSEFERARPILEGLTQRVPRHPLPWAWLARWHDLYTFQGLSDDPRREADIARSLARRALDLDPTSSLALTTAGAIQVAQFGDLDEGIDLYRQAIASNPNEALAWLMLGAALAFQGHGAAAMDASRRALSLSPLDPFRYFFDSLFATCALSAGEHATAVEAAERSLRANRLHLSTYRVLAIAQGLTGRGAAARQTVSEMLRLDPRFTVRQWLERSPGRANPLAQTYAHVLSDAGAPP